MRKSGAAQNGCGDLTFIGGGAAMLNREGSGAQ